MCDLAISKWFAQQCRPGSTAKQIDHFVLAFEHNEPIDDRMTLVHTVINALFAIRRSRQRVNRLDDQQETNQ